MIVCQYPSLFGHEEKTWDPSEPGSLEEIREFFKEKLKLGFRAFALSSDGKAKPIQTFDEEAERIVLTSEKVYLFQPATGG